MYSDSTVMYNHINQFENDPDVMEIANILGGSGSNSSSDNEQGSAIHCSIFYA